MEAHRLDYTERVIRIQRCNLRCRDGVATRKMEEVALHQVQSHMERQEMAIRAALEAEEKHCAWAMSQYEAAEREEAVEQKRAGDALKKAHRRAAKAAEREDREEAERQRVELVAEIKREAREEVRVMRGLRWAERVEARRISLVNHGQSVSRRRGGSRRIRANTTRKRSGICTESTLSSVCRDISLTYDLLLPAMSAMYADVLPASVFYDVVCMIRNKRRLFVEVLTTSSIASPVLLVRVLCPEHERKLPGWRAGACHIDRMCRLGYG